MMGAVGYAILINMFPGLIRLFNKKDRKIAYFVLNYVPPLSLAIFMLLQTKFMVNQVSVDMLALREDYFARLQYNIGKMCAFGAIVTIIFVIGFWNRLGDAFQDHGDVKQYDSIIEKKSKRGD